MTSTAKRGGRRDEILQVLAGMLEHPEERITTARLAAQVGVSEAALYRHFPSKARMYDSLVDFIEQSLFSGIASIEANESSALAKIPRIMQFLFAFYEANPGISRVMSGHALQGEHARLAQRVTQLQNRLATELRRILREADLSEGLRTPCGQAASLDLLMTVLDGKLASYVRSEFRDKPTAHWQEQWSVLSKALFRIQVTQQP